jgi:hypothetical protein
MVYPLDPTRRDLTQVESAVQLLPRHALLLNPVCMPGMAEGGCTRTAASGTTHTGWVPGIPNIRAKAVVSLTLQTFSTDDITSNVSALSHMLMLAHNSLHRNVGRQCEISRYFAARPQHDVHAPVIEGLNGAREPQPGLANPDVTKLRKQWCALVNHHNRLYNDKTLVSVGAE